MCFAVQWDGEKKVHTYALPDYKGYKRNRYDDSKVVAQLWKVLDEADIVIAHNGDAFDLKKIRARLIVHGFKPPSPFKTFDTLKAARRSFKFDSNKLDNIGRYLSCGRKIQTGGAELWRRCSDGDLKAWARMTRYCAQDVRLLYRVCQELRPWASYPDVRLYANREGCPKCLSSHVFRMGVRISQTRKYPRFQCQQCGTWFAGKSAIK